MNGKWKLVYDTSENCNGCWDTKCSHTICGTCGGHGHTSSEHPKEKPPLVAERDALRVCFAEASHQAGPTAVHVERLQLYLTQIEIAASILVDDQVRETVLLLAREALKP